MSAEKIKGCYAFFCDTEGCIESLETHEWKFANAVLKAKDQCWVFRNRDGEWKHYCCHGHEEMDYRGQAIVRDRK